MLVQGLPGQTYLAPATTQSDIWLWVEMEEQIEFSIYVVLEQLWI